jgi:hypothetical protein
MDGVDEDENIVLMDCDSECIVDVRYGTVRYCSSVLLIVWQDGGRMRMK